MDLTLGKHFGEPVDEVGNESALDQPYNITAGHKEDYINIPIDRE